MPKPIPANSAELAAGLTETLGRMDAALASLRGLVAYVAPCPYSVGDALMLAHGHAGTRKAGSLISIEDSATVRVKLEGGEIITGAWSYFVPVVPPPALAPPPPVTPEEINRKLEGIYAHLRSAVNRAELDESRLTPEVNLLVLDMLTSLLDSPVADFPTRPDKARWNRLGCCLEYLDQFQTADNDFLLEPGARGLAHQVHLGFIDLVQREVYDRGIL